MALMGYREYARHRNVTLRAVQKAIEAKRIKVLDVAGKPKIDSDQADQDWREHTDPVARSLLFSAGPQAPAPAAPAADLADDDDQSDAELRAVRIETMQIKRDRERLELQREQNLVVDRAEGARLRFTEFRALRDNLVNLGQRLGPLVAVETDPIRCEQIYTAALAEVLTAFADGVLTRDVMQDVDEDDDEAD